MDGTRREIFLREYECAQQSAEHHDSLLWETTAIIWGANALLVGFTLEVVARKNEELCLLTTCVAVVGIALQIAVGLLMWANNKLMNLKYDLCRNVEKALPMIVKQHSLVEANYTQGNWWKRFPLVKYLQRILHLAVDVAFIAVWVVVIWRTWS